MLSAADLFLGRVFPPPPVGVGLVHRFGEDPEDDRLPDAPQGAIAQARDALWALLLSDKEAALVPRTTFELATEVGVPDYRCRKALTALRAEGKVVRAFQNHGTHGGRFAVWSLHPDFLGLAGGM